MDLQYILKAENESGHEGVEYVTDRLEVMVPYLSILAVGTFMGTIGNLLVILAVAVSKELRTVGNLFICNLAVADMLVGCFTDIVNLLSIFQGEAFFHKLPGLCDILALVCFVGCVCSLNTICAIAINRYIHICHFQRYNGIYTWRKTVVFCALLWVLSGLSELVNSLGWAGHTFDPKSMNCIWDRTESLSASIFVSTVIIATPVCVTAVCYIMIYKHAIGQSKRVSALSTASSMPADRQGTEHSIQKHTLQVGGNKNLHAVTSPGKPRSRSTRLLRTLFTVYIVFLICWTPYLICVMIDVNDRFPAEVHLIVTLFAHFNSSCNSVLYGITNRQFRRGYLRVFQKFACCRVLKVAPLSENTNQTMSLEMTPRGHTHCRH